jgi:hypothetical protein
LGHPLRTVDNNALTGLEDLVVEAVNSAFSMAEKLRTPIQDAIDKKQIKDIHGQVIQWMFMPDGHSYKTPFQVQIAAGILNGTTLRSNRSCAILIHDQRI